METLSSEFKNGVRIVVALKEDVVLKGILNLVEIVAEIDWVSDFEKK